MKFVPGTKYVVKDKKTKEVMNLTFVSEDEDYLFFNFVRRDVPYKSADIIIAKELRKNFTIKKMIRTSSLADQFDKLNLKT